MEIYWMISFVLIIFENLCEALAHECDNSESVACRKEIQDLREDQSRYYYASDNSTLTEMCRKQVLAVNCVNAYAKECLTEEDQAYFKTLILGSDKFLDVMCFEDSELRKDYLVHSPCLRNLTRELDNCSKQYKAAQKDLDLLQDDSKVLVEKTCCIYYENIECSRNVTMETCGEEASRLVSELFRLLSGTYLVERCKPYSKYDPYSCTLVSKGSLLLLNFKLWTLIIMFYSLKYLSLQ